MRHGDMQQLRIHDDVQRRGGMPAIQTSRGSSDSRNYRLDNRRDHRQEKEVKVNQPESSLTTTDSRVCGHGSLTHPYEQRQERPLPVEAAAFSVGAEGTRFELVVGLLLRQFSKLVVSATHPPFRVKCGAKLRIMFGFRKRLMIFFFD